MDIRCKRCFKKYDDSSSLCPRCGKNPQRVNNKRYNTSTKHAEKNDKLSFIEKNLGEVSDEFDSLYYGYKDKGDILDKIWDLASLLFTKPFNGFFGYRYCEFCGTKVRLSSLICKQCRKGIEGDYDKSKTQKDYPNPQKLKFAVNEYIKNASPYVDFDEFSKKLKTYDFDVDNWNDNAQLVTGKRANKYYIIFTFSAFLLLFYGMFSDISRAYLNAYNAWFLIIFIIGIMCIVPISRLHFSETLAIYNFSIDVSRQSRDNSQIYKLYTKGLKSIELILDSELVLENIIFRAKKDADVSNLVFSLSVKEYYKKEDILPFIVLYCCKKDINLYLTKEVVVNDQSLKKESSENEILGKKTIIDSEILDIAGQNMSELSTEDKKLSTKDIKKEILYVRIDTKVADGTLSELEFDEHLKYLSSVSKLGYFMGGGFEKENGGMIIFSASDIVNAHEISKEDPIIKSGSYTYELKEWNVVLKSTL